MAERWVLKKITIQGFRGFVKSKTFSTSEPFILLDGPQRAGKSSTLVAIEWAMFGGEIAKKEIGIDERKEWKIRNTNAEEARVEIVLQKGEDILKIVRSESEKKRRGSQNFYFEINGERDTDEGKLRVILRIQPKDYFSSVHLHQEIIRALLTEEPKIRKHSLDRLLGLSKLRNVIEGIEKAEIEKSIKEEVDNRLRQIEARLDEGIKIRKTDIQKAKETGSQKGLTSNDFTENGATLMCQAIKTAIATFANQTDLTIPELPSAQTTEEQQTFLSLSKEVLRKLRDEQPNLKRQKELLEKQSQLQGFLQSYKELHGRLRKLEQERKEIHNNSGEQEKLRLRISNELDPKIRNAKERRNQIDQRASIIEEAIKYFEALKRSPETQLCPVCEKPIDDVRHLQMHLKEFRASLDRDLAPLREEIEKYEKERENLEDLIKKLDELDKKISNESQLLMKHKSDTEHALGREIKDTEDPIVILGEEVNKIREELKKIETTVKESNQRLNAIEDDIIKLKQILKVLVLEAEMNNLSKIKETDEYKEVENSRSEWEKFTKDVELIREAVKTVLDANAKAKLETAKESITKIFRVLANRSDFPDLEIDPKKFEIYAVKDGEKTSAVSIFNTGDLNCAALSIFLGLGATQEMSHNLDFVILDDPSQNLDSTHKENFVSVLNSIRHDKQILVSTSDQELAVLILNKVLRKKKHYKFDKWSPIEGAQPREV